MSNETKTCTSCQQVLPLSDFGPKQGRCRPCRKAARAEARMRAIQGGTYEPTKRKRNQSPEQRRLHRARDQVRRWTRELEKLEQWVTDKRAEVAAQVDGTVLKSMFEGLWERDIAKAEHRITSLRQQIEQKHAEAGDLRGAREKAEGREFDARAEPQAQVSSIEMLMHAECEQWAGNRLHRLRNETDDQREARYARLRDFRLWMRWHVSNDPEQIEANQTAHANAHRDALKAAERAALRTGRDAGKAYAAAYAKAQDLYQQDITAGVLFKYPPEWIAEADAEIAELKEQEAVEIASK